MSEDGEKRWCAKQRQTVLAYLDHQGIVDPNVGDWPAWHLAPIISVWAVESTSRPNWVGWWAISGDLPTDYTSCREERHPGQALRDIGERWSEAAIAFTKGQRSELMEFGSAEQERELAPLLLTRGQMLIEWSADETLWSE